MKRMMLAVAVALIGAGLFAGPAHGAEEEEEGLCPMGGTLIRVEVDEEKVSTWFNDRTASAGLADNKGPGQWYVLTTLSATDDRISILVRPGSVYFGVTGTGKELEQNDIVKAFGNDLGKLKDAIRNGMGELRKAGAVKIDGNDPQALFDAAGLGVLRKDGDWKLQIRDCKPVELDLRLER